MGVDFQEQLSREEEAWRESGLERKLRTVTSASGPVIEVGGRKLVHFASNDYLGLSDHPAIKEAAKKAIDQFGLGSRASRLICGTLTPHAALEERLAATHGSEAALAFSSGYAAAVGSLSALLTSDSVVLLDKLAHASLIDGARLSGAIIRVFGHNDLDKLEQLLLWARQRHPSARILIVTESVFSMDGDRAPLKEIVELKERHGAAMLLDEAHAVGLIGRGGRGLAEELGLAERIELRMGTLSKALGGSGGYICASRAVVNRLVQKARPFVYSTAPPPAMAAAALAALDLVESTEGDRRRARLWSNIQNLDSALSLKPSQSAILPWPVGEEKLAVELAGRLMERGFWAPAIRYPTVGRGKARLRISLIASHTKEQLVGLAEAIRSA